MKTKTITEKRKSLSLKVEGDTLIIKRPFGLNDEVFNDFIKKKEDWIQKQLKFNQIFKISFESDLVLMNQAIKLIYVKDKDNIIKNADTWVVSASTQSKALGLVERECHELLLNKINERINVLHKIKPFNYSAIKIKNLKASWGNCNSRRELSFAFRLIHMKESFIDSVIAHEVSHLFVMNHSPAFYHVLSQFDPNYRSSIKDLLDQ